MVKASYFWALLCVGCHVPHRPSRRPSCRVTFLDRCSLGGLASLSCLLKSDGITSYVVPSNYVAEGSISNIKNELVGAVEVISMKQKLNPKTRLCLFALTVGRRETGQDKADGGTSNFLYRDLILAREE